MAHANLSPHNHGSPCKSLRRNDVQRMSAASGVPTSTTASTSIGWVHVQGLPWELDQSAAGKALETLLPAGATLIEPPFLPVDKRLRRTGRAMLRVEACAPCSMEEVVSALHGSHVLGDCSGSRWLEARASSAEESAHVQRDSAQREKRAREHAPQTFCQASDAHAVTMPDDQRDIVLLCHETRPEVASGSFDLNNLPSVRASPCSQILCPYLPPINARSMWRFFTTESVSLRVRQGRVDVLARCVAASMFVSHGVRRNVRVWLMLRDVGITLRLSGMSAKGLHPDERTLASAIKKALRAAASTQHAMPPGWRAYTGDTSLEALEARLRFVIMPTSPGNDGGQGSDGDSTRANGVGTDTLGECDSGGCIGSGPACASSALSTRRDQRCEPARLVVLHEQGVPLGDALLRAEGHEPAAAAAAGSRRHTVIVLGSHHGFTADEEALLSSLRALRACVSPLPLLGSHCIILAHAELDRAFVSGI